MSSRRLRLSLGVALSLSFAVAACDRPNDITSPSSNAVVATPQYSKGNSDERSVKGLHPVVVSVTAHDSNICRIGSGGGFCAVSGAMIVVPANAVKKDTYFEIRLNVGPNVIVSLAASSKECRKNCDDDVGSEGFKKPITLVVSKFGANSSGLQLGTVLGGGFKPVLTFDLGSFVTGEITHFSDYGLLE